MQPNFLMSPCNPGETGFGRSEDPKMATPQLAVIHESAARTAALLGEREVSEMTGVRLSTLRYLFLIGQVPEYREENGRVLCSFADVQKWQRLRSAAHARLMASYRGAQ
jgi:hypothetical protein